MRKQLMETGEVSRADIDSGLARVLATVHRSGNRATKSGVAALELAVRQAMTRAGWDAGRLCTCPDPANSPLVAKYYLCLALVMSHEFNRDKHRRLITTSCTSMCLQWHVHNSGVCMHRVALLPHA